jgi:hypothetical protein
MHEKRLKDSKSFDSRLIQAYLDEHNGQLPDNFVESAEGGGVDSELWSLITPEQRQAVRDGLDKRLADLNPNVLDENGNLRYD